ncbi:MAG: twin-arginine translocation signal domain-containing protein, partial [Opitutales bacterium]|nr:twin-arginine translocation signal domain-containing protein [Opitutales bacterium]
MKKFTRRQFIQTSTAAGVGVLGAPAILNAANKGDKLRVAFIGTGGINRRHITDTLDHGDICGAYCDVDSSRYTNIHEGIDGLEKSGNSWMAKQWKAAKPFQDYREMFDKAANSF